MQILPLGSMCGCFRADSKRRPPSHASHASEPEVVGLRTPAHPDPRHHDQAERRLRTSMQRPRVLLLEKGCALATIVAMIAGSPL